MKSIKGSTCFTKIANCDKSGKPQFTATILTTNALSNRSLFQSTKVILTWWVLNEQSKQTQKKYLRSVPASTQTILAVQESGGNLLWIGLFVSTSKLLSSSKKRGKSCSRANCLRRELVRGPMRLSWRTNSKLSQKSSKPWSREKSKFWKQAPWLKTVCRVKF